MYPGQTIATASANLRSGRFRTDVQGLRGVAVLLVVAYHAGLPLEGGFVGVDVFFVVSGLVITRMLVAELEETGRIDLFRFYSRRAKRLLPALALLLVVVTLASIGLGALGSLEQTSWTAAATALFVANMELYRFGNTGYFGQASLTNPLLHTWSLSVEEQFYMFFPALLAVAWRARSGDGGWGGTSPVRTLVVSVCGASFLLAAAMTLSPGRFLVSDPRMFSFYSAPTRAWEFGLGVLVALTPLPPSMGRLARLASAVIGGLLIAWSAFTYSDLTPFPGAGALPPALGTALLLAAGGNPGRDPWPIRFLENKALVRIGDVSYSWYLWHWPCIVFARALFPGYEWVPPAVALLSWGPAWVSYVAVEDPIRHWNPRSSARIAVLVLACVVLPLLGAAALSVVNRRLPEVAAIKSYTDATRLHLDATQGCDEGATLEGTQARPCVWPAPNQRGRIVLVGDSNAGHFIEPVVAAAQSLGLSVEVTTLAACPFAEVAIRRNGVEQDRCRSFYAARLARIAATLPDLVITASASDAYVREDAYALALPGSNLWRERPDEKAILWARGLAATLGAIRQTGAKVLMVNPIPRLQQWQAGSCAVVVVALRAPACGVSRDLDAALRERSAALSVELEVARTAGALVMDPARTVCPGSSCAAWRDGVWWYRDSGHLSVDGALALTPRFRESIKSALGLP